MRVAPNELRIPDLGLLQWWAASPWEQQHWYVDETQQAYRVTLDGDQPIDVSDNRGNIITRNVTTEPDDAQEVLL
jgi:hypothetical protein